MQGPTYNDRIIAFWLPTPWRPPRSADTIREALGRPKER